ncbi:MAG: transcription antitermination factor NusB, partial [Pseudomonadota bacterium]
MPPRPAPKKTHAAQQPLPDGAPARLAARDLLALVLDKRWSLDDALAGCRSFARLEGADRAFARAIASTVLRRLGQIDGVLARFVDRPLGKKGKGAQDLLRLGAGQILFLGTPAHAAVSVIVAMSDLRRETKPYKGLVNAVLRKVADRRENLIQSEPLRANVPGWLWRSWERAYGPVAAKAMSVAHAAEAPLDLTVKPGAPIPDGGQATPTGSQRFPAGTGVTEIPGYDAGDWWVQDAAAALPARLLGEVRGARVIDLCAAPGGKTMQLAAAGAQVIAVDRSAKRLEQVKENLARVRLNAELIEADVETWRPAAPAPYVLLDAPCSATGTFRRRPDVLWAKRDMTLGPLLGVQ